MTIADDIEKYIEGCFYAKRRMPPEIHVTKKQFETLKGLMLKPRYSFEISYKDGIPYYNDIPIRFL